MMYFPEAVGADAGGTLLVPGSHFRRISHMDIARYQNVVGQERVVCAAGTVFFLHHAIWHAGRRNDSAHRRVMYKLRLNPTVRQLRLWNTDDIADPQVTATLLREPTWAGNDGRLEQVNRARLWRFLTGDADFDLDYYLTRNELRPSAIAPEATDEPRREESQGSRFRGGGGRAVISSERIRQQVLILYLATPALDSEVCAWTLYDGTGRSRPTTGDSDVPPYATGLAALQDGWRLLQISPVAPPAPGHEYDVSTLRNEFVFERVVEVTHGVGAISVDDIADV